MYQKYTHKLDVQNANSNLYSDIGTFQPYSVLLLLLVQYIPMAQLITSTYKSALQARINGAFE